MGAGILPIAIYKNKIYFLFSREYIKSKKNAGLWSDFGGSKYKKENFEDTAIREGWEESSGFLGTKEDIKILIQNKTFTKININNEYLCFIVFINYDKDLPKTFKSNFLEIKKKNPDLINSNGLYEKDMIKWIEYNNLSKYYQTFRPRQKTIVKKLLKMKLYENKDIFNL